MAPITLGVNVDNLRAQGQLNRTSKALSSSFSRLSTGLRIVNPSDDASGAAVAASLKLNSIVFTQGVRNLNDGISALSIAENGLVQANTILSRVSELANQASNGAYSSAQRQALDSEADALINEYNRIIQTTSFNGRNLLDGGYTDVRFQGGFGASGSIAVTVGEGSTSSSGSTTTVGNGTFGNLTSGYGGIPGSKFAVGDLNGDGFGDIVRSGDLVNVSVINFGNGNGTFGTDSYTGSNIGFGSPAAVTLADFNGDGKLDIASTNGAASSQLAVYLNNGNGTFGSATTYSDGNVTSDIASADIDGDGDKDIVTSARGSGVVSVFYNTGGGSFSARTSYSAGVSTEAITLADLNGDNRVEIIAVSRNQSKIYVLNNNGNGTFAAGISYASGTSTYDVEAADLDNDGDQDIVTVSSTDAKINVHLNSGGSLAAAVTYAGSTSNNSLSLGDFNGDGFADVLVNGSLAGGFKVAFNTGTGGFGAGTVLGNYNLAIVRAADLNNDGVKDFVTLDGPNEELLAQLTNTTTTSTGGSSTVNLTLSLLDLTTQSSALTALATVQTARDTISNELGKVGSYQSRLDSAVRALGTRAAETQASLSRLTDVDVAAEVSEMVKLQIRQDATSAVLAQANISSNIALQLLGA